jgi:hypothetical protein
MSPQTFYHNNPSGTDAFEDRNQKSEDSAKKQQG